MFSKDSITVLDNSMKLNEVRLIKSLSHFLGFDLINQTGEPLFIEPIFHKDELGNDKLVMIFIKK